MAGEEPDSIFACCGGGSNFAGLAFPFIGEKITKKKNYRIVGVEPSACPTMTRSEEYTSELQSLRHLGCRLLLEKKYYSRGHHSPGRYHRGACGLEMRPPL